MGKRGSFRDIGRLHAQRQDKITLLLRFHFCSETHLLSSCSAPHRNGLSEGERSRKGP